MNGWSEVYRSAATWSMVLSYITTLIWLTRFLLNETNLLWAISGLFLLAFQALGIWSWVQIIGKKGKL